MTTTPPPGHQADLEHELSSLRRSSTTLTIARAVSYVAYAWVIASLLILTFGFFLLLFNANPEASFAQWVYRHLADTMEPFRGIFPQQTTPAGATFDVSVLFAMLVYGLIAVGVRSVIDWLTSRRNRLQRNIARDQSMLRSARAAQDRAPTGQPEYRPSPEPRPRDPYYDR